MIILLFIHLITSFKQVLTKKSLKQKSSKCEEENSVDMKNFEELINGEGF